MRQSHLIISNAAGMWLSQALAIIPPLIMIPYLIGTIGEVGYGVYALTWSLIMSIDQLEKSLQSGVVKYSAAFLAQGAIDEVNKVVSSSFVYSIFLAIIISASVLLASIFYQDSSGKLSMLLIVVSVMLLFVLPLTPYVALIQAKQRYFINAFADTASKYIILLIVIIWFSAITPSVEALIIITAVVLFFARLIQVPLAYRLVPSLQNKIRLFNKGSFKLIFSFGAATVLISVCLALNNTGIRWLMEYLASARFLAHFSIILLPVSLLWQIIGAVTMVLMPIASAYEAQKNYILIEELLYRGIRWTVILLIILLFVAVFLMKDVLILWVGKNYAFLAPYALALLVCVAFFQSTSSAHHILKGLGKLSAVFLIYFLGLVVVPIVVILLMSSFFKNSYFVATLGLCIGYVVCGLCQIIVSMRLIKLRVKDLIVNTYIYPILIAFVEYIVIIIVLKLFNIDGIISHTVTAIVATVMFCVCCYMFIATQEEKRKFTELLNITKEKMKVVKIFFL